MLHLHVQNASGISQPTYTRNKTADNVLRGSRAGSLALGVQASTGSPDCNMSGRLLSSVSLRQTWPYLAQEDPAEEMQSDEIGGKKYAARWVSLQKHCRRGRCPVQESHGLLDRLPHALRGGRFLSPPASSLRTRSCRYVRQQAPGCPMVDVCCGRHVGARGTTAASGLAMWTRVAPCRPSSALEVSQAR